MAMTHVPAYTSPGQNFSHTSYIVAGAFIHCNIGSNSYPIFPTVFLVNTFGSMKAGTEAEKKERLNESEKTKTKTDG